MFTATLIAALVAAGVATAKAIGKGVQAKRQRESREKEQKRHLSAAEKVALKTERHRAEFKQQQMQGMRHQFAQMQPLQDAMTRAYGGTAGYVAPNMDWLMKSRTNPLPPLDFGEPAGPPKVNVTKAARDPDVYTGAGHAAPQQGPR